MPSAKISGKETTVLEHAFGCKNWVRSWHIRTEFYYPVVHKLLVTSQGACEVGIEIKGGGTFYPMGIASEFHVLLQELYWSAECLTSDPFSYTFLCYLKHSDCK